jgi:hypothetical protein
MCNPKIINEKAVTHTNHRLLIHQRTILSKLNHTAITPATAAQAYKMDKAQNMVGDGLSNSKAMKVLITQIPTNTNQLNV